MMRTIYIVCCLLTMGNTVHSQSAKKDVYFNFLSDGLYIKADVLNKNHLRITVKKDSNTTASFEVNPYVHDTFVELLIKNIKSLHPTYKEFIDYVGTDRDTLEMQKKINQTASQFFYQFRVLENVQNSSNDDLAAGIICLDNEIMIQKTETTVSEKFLKKYLKNKKVLKRKNNKIVEARKNKMHEFNIALLSEYPLADAHIRTEKGLKYTYGNKIKTTRKNIGARLVEDLEASNQKNFKAKETTILNKLDSVCYSKDSFERTKTHLEDEIKYLKPEGTLLIDRLKAEKDNRKNLKSEQNHFKILLSKLNSLSDSIKIRGQDIKLQISLDSLKKLNDSDTVSIKSPPELIVLSQQNNSIQKNIMNVEQHLRENNKKIEEKDSLIITIRKDIQANDSIIQIKEQSSQGLDLSLDSLLQTRIQLLSELKNHYSSISKIPFKVESVQLEFSRGYIENVIVKGHTSISIKDPCGDTHLLNEKRTIKFQNEWPFGFSRKRDYSSLKSAYLFSPDKKFRVNLQDLFSEDYYQFLVNYRRDYSPKDFVLTADLKSGILCDTLMKNQTLELFEAQTFTDLVGFNENEPNGVIQFEINKKVHLHTRRVLPFNWTRINLGFFENIQPFFRLSKIEEDDKYLVPSTQFSFTNNQLVTTSYASTLQLKQHENFSLGFDVNLLLIDIPTFKSTIYVDAGFRYGRTSIRDSLYSFVDETIINTKATTTYGTNNYEPGLRVTWDIQVDERYGFNLWYRYNCLYSRNDNFLQVGNLRDYELNSIQGNNRFQYSTIGLLAYLDVNPKDEGRLFFRYQLNWQRGYWNTTFAQAQLGYSFFITKFKNPQ